MHSSLPCSAALIALACLPGLAQAVEPAIPVAGYTLVHQDEFAGNQVDERQWNYRLGLRTGVNINGYNTKDAVTVGDGRLQITCTQTTDNGKLTNAGGGLISKKRYGYGFYETKCTAYMAGRGVHSAFWQRGMPNENNLLFEIDGFELDSTEHVASHNLYVYPSSKGFSQVPWPCRANVPVAFQADGSFISGYDYTPEGVTFYENGIEVARADFPHYCAAQNVWLTALNGVGKVDPEKFPGTTTFDYFRYYNKLRPGVNLLPNGDFEYNLDRIDLQEPLAWDETGNRNASQIVTGSGAHGAYWLHQGADFEFQISTHQDLDYLLPGTYVCSALVRSTGGQDYARLRVSDFGGVDQSVDIPAATAWTRITIPNIAVTNGHVRIDVESLGKAGQGLDIDDIRFETPALAGGSPVEQPPYRFTDDPIWSIGNDHPITFTGDRKFYFFDRKVGLGDAISVEFTLTPERLENMGILARMPKSGTAGWGVILAADGSLVFRLGSQEKSHDVRTPPVCAPGKAVRVACVYDRGSAWIAINGAVVVKAEGIPFTTNETATAGRMGDAGGVFQAVGDVMVRTEGAAPAGERSLPKALRGTLAQVAIRNRALTMDEIAPRKP